MADGSAPDQDKQAAGNGMAGDAANVRGKHRPRPKDAASILLIDRTSPIPRVLVGKRSTRHVFMPDTYVFPGGRRDRQDNTARFASDFHPETRRQLTIHLGVNAPSRIRGLGICALRELFEETGICAGGERFHPDLSVLRYVAHAITPPREVRRYDTHFFACFTDELKVQPDQIRDSDELTDLRFIEFQPDLNISMPFITKWIMSDLHPIVTSGTSLQFGNAVPFYRWRNGRHVRDFIEES